MTAAAGSWRVLTWNIHGAALPDPHLLADEIGRMSPDAVALQEVRRGQARAIAGALGWHHAWVFKHNRWTVLLWWRAEGLALLSRWPLSDVERTSISSGAHRRSFRRRVMIAATVIRRAATHPSGAARAVGPEEQLRLYGTHLATDGTDHRIAQARLIADRIAVDVDKTDVSANGETDGGPSLDGTVAGRTNRPIVVAGDLNAANEVEVIREFHAVGIVDPGGDDTSPALAPYQRIDYVLVPETAQIYERFTPPSDRHWQLLSDHLPTLVEFAV
ncbi:MAG: endonuclease/exonuclease/phosphatase family protein [Ilumatobacteraceae bacterium]